MPLGFCIVYVQDVVATVSFYERAFHMERRLVAEGDVYAEMAGPVPLAFCQEAFAEKNMGAGCVPNRPDRTPAGVELGFIVEDVDAAYAHAIACGATALAAPVQKPWGQRVAYVRDPDGVLVEICTAWAPG